MPVNRNLGAFAAAAALAALAGCSEQADTVDASLATEQPEPPAATVLVDAPTQTETAAARAPTPAYVPAAPVATPAEAAAFDPGNSTFSIDGKPVALKRGISRVPAAPGSASSITTRYLGRETRGDLTGDGREDVAYFVARDAGGSGQFYYVVVAVNGAKGYRTTNAFLVGDRIELQSLRILSNELHVNYVGRKRGEAMSTPPSRRSLLLLKVSPDGRLQGLMS